MATSRGFLACGGVILWPHRASSVIESATIGIWPNRLW
jgi:hypothetical protein